MSILDSKRVLLVVLIGVVGVCQKEPEPVDVALLAQYERLEQIDLKVLREGADLTTFKHRREIRDFFVSRGDGAARFLIDRLRRMNAEEERFLQGSDDPMKGIEHIGLLIDKGRPPFLKYDTCYLLAELFPRLSEDLQTEILETFAASYLPSDYSGGMVYLNHALLQIGPRSVPELLKLANHRSKRVRCEVAALLEDFHDPNVVQGYLHPPKVDCSSDPQERRAAIAAWTKWWDTYGKNLPFPQFPSFFEVYESFKDRIPGPSLKD